MREQEVLKTLSGAKAHLCAEWDGLAIDETCPEFEACLCFEERSPDEAKVARMSADFIWESTAQGEDAYQADPAYRAIPLQWIHYVSELRIPPEDELVPPGGMKNVTPAKGWNAPKQLTAGECAHNG